MIEQMAPWFGEEEKRAVADYLESGGWLTEFRKTSDFEGMIAEYAGTKQAVAVSSGTAALFCALAASGIGSGDEVLVPDFTMIATANAVVLAGARPVFVDICRSNLCMDVTAAEKAITKRTRAILFVSFNGRASGIDLALELARKRSLKLIEDAAQSFGSRHCGKALGTFGVAGIYSFSPMKVISTGQGGAIVTDDSSLATRIRQLKDFGRAHGGIDRHETVGYNFKFTDLQAVIGIEQMKKLDWRVKRKKEMFDLYRAELRDSRSVQFVDTDLSETTPWFMDVLVERREDLISHLGVRGIKTRLFYPPLHSQPVYQWLGDFPISEDVARRGLWLPSSAFLTDDDVRYVCAAVRAFYS